MIFIDDDKPRPLFQEMNLKDISYYLRIFLDGIKYF